MKFGLARGPSTGGTAKHLLVFALAILLLLGSGVLNARELSAGMESASDRHYQGPEPLAAKKQGLRRLTESKESPTRSFLCDTCEPYEECQAVLWCRHPSPSMTSNSAMDLS